MGQFLLRKKYWLAFLLLLLAGVTAKRALHALSKKRCASPVTIDAWKLPSGEIFIAEDPENKKLQRYRFQEHLDQVVQPYSTDVQKILALAKWASRQFPASTPFPNYPPWNAPVILDRIRHGKTGGYCAQYAFVFGQACQSFGYQVRYLDIASPMNNGGHFTTEIYVPSLRRWIVFEPEWGYYYADDQGQPLDALQLHEIAVGHRKGAVYKMPTREVADPGWLKLFYYFRYYLRSNYLSVPVFIRRLDHGSIEFSHYRLAWNDSYTDDIRNEESSFMSSDPHDFEFALRSSNAEPLYCNKRTDLYYQLAQRPSCTLCRFTIPHDVLVRLIKLDFTHDPTYHRLKA